MEQNYKRMICIMLIIIILFSIIMIYKINQTPVYNQELYEQVYKEYEQIESISTNIQTEKVDEKENSSNTIYKTIAKIYIPKIRLSYPVINECTEENLNIAPVKLVGPTPNTEGNLVIVGHNNWNYEFFSNLYKLEKGDIVKLTGRDGKTSTYTIYKKYQIEQSDFSCLSQDTQGRTELTLITCVKYQKNKRLVIKCVKNEA